MKKISIIILLALLGLNSNAQSIKSKELSVMYIKPPSEKVQINRTYMWLVKEIATGQRDTAIYFSGSNSYHIRQNYFTTGNFENFGGLKQIKYVPGDRIQGEDFSYVEGFFGPTEIISKKAYSKGTAKKADGTQGPAWNLAITLDIKKYIKMYYFQLNGVPSEHQFQTLVMRNGNDYVMTSMPSDYLINDLDMNGEHKKSFHYPNDIDKAKSFTSEAAVNAGFNKDWPSIEKTMRKNIINAFILKSRRIIQSKYSNFRDLIHLEAYSVKDKEGAYPEFESWLEQFKLIETEISKQDELKSKMNWHTPEAQSIIVSTLQSVSAFIESHQEAPISVLTAARMNKMWLLFLNNQFENAISECNSLIQLQKDLEEELATAKKEKIKLDKVKKKSMEAAIDGIKYNKLGRSLNYFEDYMPRYQVNADSLGWK